MKNREYDVIVIGAGPAGSITSRFLALQGFQVLMIEKRPIIGSPVRCGEATSNRDKLAEYGPISEESFETDLDGMLFYGAGVRLEAKIPKMGVMLNRLEFDPCLARNAEAVGVEVLTSARATNVFAVTNGRRVVRIDYQNQEYDVTAKMVVGADGAEALTGRWTGLKTRQLPPKTCSAIELKLDVLDPNPTWLTFWQGHDTINDGYIWSFPKVKSGVTNFGCGFITPKLGAPNVYEVADEWREKFFPGSKILNVMGGAVPVSGVLQETVADHFMLVGDSGHHTNPLTGGGIAAAMHAGKIAAELIGKALNANSLSKADLQEYEKRCWAEFGKRHYRDLLIRDYVMSKNLEEQKSFYQFIQNVNQYGKVGAVITHPIRTLKFAKDYLDLLKKVPERAP